MNIKTTSPNAPDGVNWARAALFMIVCLGALRLGLMMGSPLNLHGDEAQYWDWAQDLDWGYFTKPPMIAWVIAATTALFGDAEWAVRLSSPVLHSVTAYFIFTTARFAFEAKTGFWAALIYLLMPAVWLSSGIVSTDVPLLLFWTIALNGWLHLRHAPRARYALQLGAAIGLGILSKYAMLFFLPALGLVMIADPDSRKALISRYGVLALGVTALIIAPNMIWNLNNDFATFDHTVANANLDGFSLHPLEWAGFAAEQLGVFGPISLALLIASIVAALKGHPNRRLKTPSIWLAAFTLSPLLIISAEALLSRANANWAVTAYISGSILSAHMLVTYWARWKRVFITGTAVTTAFCLAVIMAVLNPLAADQFGLSNSLKRVRGWPDTAALIAAQYKAGHEGLSYSHIMTDNRRVFFSLNYYGLPHSGARETAPLKMWPRTAHAQNHAELNYALEDGVIGPVLIMAYFHGYTDELKEDFSRLVPLPPLEQELGGGKRRSYNVWAGYGYKKTDRTSVK